MGGFLFGKMVDEFNKKFDWSQDVVIPSVPEEGMPSTGAVQEGETTSMPWDEKESEAPGTSEEGSAVNVADEFF